MKKLFLLIVVGVVLAAVVTCPDKAAHQAAVVDELNVAMNDKISESLEGNDFKKGLSFFGGAVASRIVNSLTESTLKVNNYFVFSTGEINAGEKTRLVSVGLFGHVYTLFSADDVKDSMKDFLGGK